MASISKRRTQDGVRYLAEVRITGFKPARLGGFVTRKAAEDWAEETEKTLKAERARGNLAATNPATLTVRALRELYLKDPETQKLATAEERADQLEWWCGWAELRDVKADKKPCERVQEFIGPANITGGRDRLVADFAEQTVNNYLAAARRMINWARETGKIPAAWVWPPGLSLTVDNERQVEVPDETVDRILDEALSEGVVMYVASLWNMGVANRETEMLATKWGDIRESDNSTAVDPTKTDTARRVHVPPAVMDALKLLYIAGERPADDEHVFRHEVAMPWKEWAEQLGMPLGEPREGRGLTLGKMRYKAKREGLTRPTVLRVMTVDELYNRWKKIRTRAGVPWLWWHDARHLLAGWLIRHGATLKEVGIQLGHLSPLTTNRYTHLLRAHKPQGADAVNTLLSRRRAATSTGG